MGINCVTDVIALTAGQLGCVCLPEWIILSFSLQHNNKQQERSPAERGGFGLLWSGANMTRYRNDWMMQIYNYSQCQAVCCFLGWSTSCLIEYKMVENVDRCFPKKSNGSIHGFQNGKLTQQMSCSCPAKHTRSTSYTLSGINRSKHSLLSFISLLIH